MGKTYELDRVTDVHQAFIDRQIRSQSHRIRFTKSICRNSVFYRLGLIGVIYAPLAHRFQNRQ